MKTILAFCLGIIISLAHSATAQTRAEHVLGPQDTIEVRVFQEPDLDTTVTVGQDGRVSLPLIGPVAVGGMTAAAASQSIVQRYKQGYLVNPNVTVAIAEYAKRRFTVLGAVNKPGSFYFPPGENLTLLQAIGMAGGYSRLANPAKVFIKRKSLKEPLKVDAKKLAKNNDGGGLTILPDDVINIEESVF